jgi:hypothetical protein
MILYDGCFRRYDYVENDVDVDVPLTTFPQKSQQQDFWEIRRQLFSKSGFQFPLKQVKNRKWLVIKDAVASWK